MPARQGAIVWPAAGARCQSVLVDERRWPIPDASVDRLLAVHCLEQSGRVGPLLREMWRVLKPDGRLLIIVPNRRGVWSRLDFTPFGHGLPFSRAQLEAQLTDALFTPVEWSEALYFPPFDRRMLLRMAPAIERFGSRMSIGVAGVVIAQARKELVAPVAGGLASREVNVLKPAESGLQSGRLCVFEAA
jgi:SAM-dependent methyltransferase